MAPRCGDNAGMRNPPLRLAEALGHPIADKRLDILRRIDAVGSISEAARGAGVSYKAAWQAIDTLSNLAGTALVQRLVGGAGGGGAQLTDAARQLLATAALLDAARAQVLAQLNQPLEGSSIAALPSPAAMGLRTSMRNQLPCTVQSIRTQGQAVDVVMALPDAVPLRSRITRASAELLALQPGLPVLALCKATAVQVGPQAPASATSNTLQGHVTRVSRAAAGGEVALQLGCGSLLVGFCGPSSGLRAGAACHALVEASAVVIALAP